MTTEANFPFIEKENRWLFTCQAESTPGSSSGPSTGQRFARQRRSRCRAGRTKGLVVFTMRIDLLRQGGRRGISRWRGARPRSAERPPADGPDTAASGPSHPGRPDRRSARQDARRSAGLGAEEIHQAEVGLPVADGQKTTLRLGSPHETDVRAR
jgi:hypothetical protein